MEKLITSESPFILGGKKWRGCKMLKQEMKTVEEGNSLLCIICDVNTELLRKTAQITLW